MAAQPIFRKGAVWWWCEQGRSTTTVFVGWSVLAQSTQPSNHHLEFTTAVRSPIPICGTYETRIEPTTGREQWEWEKKTCSSWFIISFSFQWRLGPKTVPTSVWNSLHGKSQRNYQRWKLKPREKKTCWNIRDTWIRTPVSSCEISVTWHSFPSTDMPWPGKSIIWHTYIFGWQPCFKRIKRIKTPFKNQNGKK